MAKQANTPGTVGTVNVQFTGEIGDLQAKTQQAERTVKGAAQQMDKSAAQAGVGWRRQAGLLTATIGRVSAVVGVFASLFALGHRMRELVVETEKLQRGLEAIGDIDITNTSTALGQLNTEIGELQQALGALQGVGRGGGIGAAFDWFFARLFQGSEETIKRLLADAEQRRQTAEDYAQKKRNFEDAERARKFKEALKEAADDFIRKQKDFTDDLIRQIQVSAGQLQDVLELRQLSARR